VPPFLHSCPRHPRGGGEGKSGAEAGLFQTTLQVLTACQTVSGEPAPPKPAPEPVKSKLPV
jgi:hypothetical protein